MEFLSLIPIVTAMPFGNPLYVFFIHLESIYFSMA